MFGWGLARLSTLVLGSVAWRAASVPWLTKRLAQRTLWIEFTSPCVVMAGARLVEHRTWIPSSALLGFMGMTLLGAIFL